MRRELEDTDAAFGGLAARVGFEHWHTRPEGGPWSAGQTLTHILLIHEFVPQLVANARRGRGAFNFPWLVAHVNVLGARWAGSRTDALRVAGRHHHATATTLALIDTLAPHEWERSARFFSRGQYTMERLVRLPIQHYAEHAPDIGRMLAR
ncbi:MAG: DinB family protein [Dehalococcoidia bacterium]|nr:DinB family protein [Dehalococcoidia bacterium]